MTINQLLKLINIQDDVFKIIKKSDIPLAAIQDALPKLTHQPSWQAGLSELKQILLPDGDGMKMLVVHLFCAANAYGKYQELGIPDNIYIDTMKCFVRFVGQCKTVFNKWMFDREWWTVRQISLLLFRIGQLEFELNQIDGEKCVNIHIPSDASIEPHLCKQSIDLAKVFIAKRFPQYKNCDFVCDSWLLSPCLKLLLPSSSNIIKFLNMFELQKTNDASTDFMLYVFNTNSSDYKNLPEKTTLQKNMKSHLLSGGKVGSTFGILKSGK